MDKNGYPDNKELRKIKNWDYLDLASLMAYVEDLWKYADCGYWRKGRKYYHISTGGWSGNESIINALKGNAMFWALYWCSSTRGGHYKFEISKALKGV